MTIYTPDQIREHRHKFLDALRSGKYAQGRNALRTEKGQFCCLGVACQVSGLGSFTGKAYWINGDPTYNYLPMPVAEWLGWSWERDNPHNKDGQSFADSMNDRGVPFSAIADSIEETFRADQYGY